mmetsp:Transcript_42622/g.90238  ORF Transcript_42622/g.90238 Transcript_42622/m.90238 type:complete len:1305 (+) Transcript_42622:64-3978(+)
MGVEMEMKPTQDRVAAVRPREDDACWLDRELLQSWVTKIFVQADKQGELSLENLGAVGSRHESRALHAKFEEVRSRNPKAGVAKSLMLFVGRCNLLFACLTDMAASGLLFVPAVMTFILLEHLDGDDDKKLDTVQLGFLCSAYFVVPSMSATLQAYTQRVLAQHSLHIYSVLTSSVYMKSLKLHPSVRSSLSSGKIVNLMTADAGGQMQQVMRFVIPLITAPLMLAVILYAVAQVVGSALIAGLLAVLLCVLQSGLCFVKVGKYLPLMFRKADGRMKTVTDLMAGIRVAKYYAWEDAFLAKLRGQRAEELHYNVLQTRWSIMAIGGAFVFMPLLLQFCTILFYRVLDGDNVAPSKVWTTVQLLTIVQLPLARLPQGMQNVVSALVSCKRIGLYLAKQETDQHFLHPDPKPEAIKIENGQFHWMTTPSDAQAEKQEESPKKRRRNKKPDLDAPVEMGFQFRGVNVAVQQGEFTVVVGTTGSGKSSLLMAMLGEMESTSGTVCVNGKVGYCAQVPWIMGDTLRNNVLFSEPMDFTRYVATLEACQLVDDLKTIEGGDFAEIGDRGINLSGGQRARVALARAVYSEADVFLFDDVLAAVDSHVGQRLLENLVKTRLQGKTRVLVTHKLAVARQADKVIWLDNGRVVTGTYQELREKEPQFVKMMETAGEEDDEDDQEEQRRTRALTDPVADGGIHTTGEVTHLKKSEQKLRGVVAMSVYKYYFKAMGFFSMCYPLILLHVGCLGGTMLSIGLWSQAAADGDENSDMFFVLYGVFVGSAMLCFVVGGQFLASAKGTSGTIIFGKVTKAVLDAPISWFDVTPAGQILSRFSKDLQDMDQMAPLFLMFFTMIVGNCLRQLLEVTIITRGVVLVVVAPAVYFFITRVVHFMRRVAVALQRLEAAQRAPIYDTFSEVLNGLHTVRSYKKEDVLRETHYSQMNNNMVALHMVRAAVPCWCNVRISMGSAAIVTCAVVFGVVAHSEGYEVEPGMVGLAIVEAMAISSTLLFICILSSEVDSKMSAIERLKEYEDTVPKEALARVEDVDSKLDEIQDGRQWPWRGNIEFRALCVGYREGPTILKSLSLTIGAGQKVGVCGRTGCGKSTMMLSMLRVLEPRDGGIFIDGIETAKVGLRTLRSRIGLIPQDPVVFSGDLRYNLDPFGAIKDDEVIWQALERVLLKDLVSGFPNKLQELCAEGGDNLSVGQRQLLCIGRALLRDPAILMLDEATASIDLGADASMQSMIAEQFKRQTVLAIAHRLETIIDSDLVIVLDQGVLSEFDSPKKLLQTPGSAFRSMAEAAGLGSTIGSAIRD